MKYSLWLFVVLAFFISSCNSKQDSPLTEDTAMTALNETYTQLEPSSGFYQPYIFELGSLQALGDGSMMSFGLTQGNKPITIGTVFSDFSLENMPTSASDGSYDIRDATGTVVWECCGHELSLSVPPTMRQHSAFEHIVVNWNPNGHIPANIYDIPHFDFHFYTISEQERRSITAPASAADMCNGAPLDCTLLARATAPLPADAKHPDFSDVNAVEPAMGNHLLDLANSPEFNGGTFSRTWIYGQYDSKVIFWEPMITLANIQENRARNCTAIKLPEAMTSAGYYPREYCTRYHAFTGLYMVTLEDFVYLEQADGILNN